MIHKKVLFCTLLLVHGFLFGMLTERTRQRSKSLPPSPTLHHQCIANQQDLIMVLRQQVDLKTEWDLEQKQWIARQKRQIDEQKKEQQLAQKEWEVEQARMKYLFTQVVDTCGTARAQYYQLHQLPWLHFKKNLFWAGEIGTYVGMSLCVGYLGLQLQNEYCMQATPNNPLLTYLCYPVR